MKKTVVKPELAVFGVILLVGLAYRKLVSGGVMKFQFLALNTGAGIFGLSGNGQCRQ